MLNLSACAATVWQYCTLEGSPQAFSEPPQGGQTYDKCLHYPEEGGHGSKIVLPAGGWTGIYSGDEKFKMTPQLYSSTGYAHTCTKSTGTQHIQNEVQ